MEWMKFWLTGQTFAVVIAQKDVPHEEAPSQFAAYGSVG